jgi:2-polyprenyl-3-methyl-5-hydroxy-6-metoxy-1,4-benzoquinol methylase
MTARLPELQWTQEMAVRFWDYESNFPERYFTYRHGAEIVRQLRKHLLRRGTVLDYGCGPGYLLAELLDAGIEAAGLDFSPATVGTVNERFGGRANFRGAFVPEQLKDSAHAFSVVTLLEVVEHLYDEPLDRLLEELPRLLAPEGIVVVTTPNEEDLTTSTLLCPVSGQVFHRWQHVRSWSQQSLTLYLQSRGYQVLQCFPTNFRGGLSKAKNKGGLAARWAVLKSELNHHLGTSKKAPHLVAIARPPS